MRIGRRLIHDVVDTIAAEQPEKVMLTYQPFSDSEWKSVNFATLRNAVNRMAWWLSNVMEGLDSRTFCYIGPPDLRYYFVLLGASKASYKVRISFGVLLGRDVHHH